MSITMPLSSSPPTTPLSPRCEEISHVSYTNFALSLFILLGILVSYLPQHIRIIRRRSSYGLSPWFVLLGTTSGTCAFANILVLPKSRLDVGCCRDVDGFACLAGLLGIAQVGVQWSCFTLILLLFLIFFPREDTTITAIPSHPSSPTRTTAALAQTLPSTNDTTTVFPPPESNIHHHNDHVNDATTRHPNGKPKSLLSSSESATHTHLPPTYRLALAVTGISILHAVLTMIVSGLVLILSPQNAQPLANILGLSSTLLASIQYFPQIHTTWMLGTVGSLSIPMMCIQTPGSFVWAGSLAARFGIEGWSTWGVYLVTGCLQGTLLVMGIIFEYRNWKNRKLVEEAEGVGQQDSEETPLLGTRD
ncbi:hypothetical protein PV10_05218 [Exophiala mesophila]|uniref:PQ loop repeat protein n=1 Tax=Exophiala mesophila TaxID=212818 RepID=A0A0D1Y0Q1_EXOME|nr:uncharacterized protein PV10_05218 [Exophiala mesophila]KIV94061.1 hypothetical protein PV10_05218 [Exophiala mesophila]